MSYDQLADHSVKLEESAVKAELAQRGYKLVGDNIVHDKQTVFDIETSVTAAQNKFAGVAEMFAPFLYMPEPKQFRRVVSDLRGVAQTLNSQSSKFETAGEAVGANTDLGAMSSVGNLIANWRGGAAILFRKNFLSTWPGITSNQFALVMALKGAMEAEAAMWTAARSDADTIAHQAQAALDSMLECNPKHIAFALTVAGSVLAVVALPVAAAGAAAAGTITVLSEAASSAGAYPVADKDKLPLSGNTASEIVNNTRAALNALTRQIIDTENRIRDALEMTTSAVFANHADYVAPRPRMADMTPSTVRDDDVGLGDAVG